MSAIEDLLGITGLVNIFNSANAIFLNGFQSLVTFFKVIIAFIPHTLEYLMIIFSVLIVLIPAILSTAVYFTLHLWIILKIVECFILMRFIITAGFFEKLHSFFDSHIMLIKFIIELPKFLVELNNSFMIMIQSGIEILKYIRDLVLSFMGWISTAISNPNTIQAGFVTALLLVIFSAFLVALFSP